MKMYLDDFSCDGDGDDGCSEMHKRSNRQQEKREMAIVKIYAILNECHILIAAPENKHST